MKKADLRKHRTRILFSEAFLQLLAEKNLSSITVKDLITRAELNRSTFYLHYLDMPDFIESTLTQVFDGLNAQLGEFCPLNSNQLYAYYNTYLVWFDKHRILLQALQTTNYAPMLWQTLDTVCYRYLSSLTGNDKMHTLYLSTADRGLFKEWLLNNHDYSLEDLAQLLAQSTASIIGRS